MKFFKKILNKIKVWNKKEEAKAKFNKKYRNKYTYMLIPVEIINFLGFLLLIKLLFVVSFLGYNYIEGKSNTNKNLDYYSKKEPDFKNNGINFDNSIFVRKEYNKHKVTSDTFIKEYNDFSHRKYKEKNKEYISDRLKEIKKAVESSIDSHYYIIKEDNKNIYLSTNKLGQISYYYGLFEKEDYLKNKRIVEEIKDKNIFVTKDRKYLTENIYHLPSYTSYEIKEYTDCTDCKYDESGKKLGNTTLEILGLHEITPIENVMGKGITYKLYKEEESIEIQYINPYNKGFYPMKHTMEELNEQIKLSINSIELIKNKELQINIFIFILYLLSFKTRKYLRKKEQLERNKKFLLENKPKVLLLEDKSKKQPIKIKAKYVYLKV